MMMIPKVSQCVTNTLETYMLYIVKCCFAEDKKGGVDRSTTVIAKEPEGNFSKFNQIRLNVFFFILAILTDIWIALPASKPSQQLSTSSQSSGSL